MVKNPIHELAKKYPRTDIRKKGWVYKRRYGKTWHWALSMSGVRALARKK